MSASSSALVTALTLYPVKSLQGYDLQSAWVEPCGLAGDRRWLVVDRDGVFLTQRQFTGMAQLSVRQEAGGIRLQAASLESIAVAFPERDAEQIEVVIWRSNVMAALAGRAADAWLSQALGTECRLVYLADPQARAVEPPFAQAQDRVSFADGFPVLLASESSLDDLNRRLDRPIPMRRFRPNLVVSGALHWAEDGWRRVRIGEAVFRVAKPCSRCLVTTVDQQTGERPVPDEPLRTLAQFRRAQGGVMFGQNLIPEALGTVSVGDQVVVLEQGTSNLVPIQR